MKSEGSLRANKKFGGQSIITVMKRYVEKYTFYV